MPVDRVRNYGFERCWFGPIARESAFETRAQHDSVIRDFQMTVNKMQTKDFLDIVLDKELCQPVQMMLW